MRRQGLDEALAQFGRNRLRAVEDQSHRRQVQPCRALRLVLLEVVLIAEIGRTQHRGAAPARQFQPQQRPAREQIGAHDQVAHAASQHVQMKADQAHVVRQRHPAQGDVAVSERRGFANRTDIRADIAVAQHHALGLAGGTGGELNESDIVRGNLGRPAWLAGNIKPAGQQQALLQTAPALAEPVIDGESVELFEGARIAADPGAIKLRKHPEQLATVLLAAARRERHRDDGPQHAGPEYFQKPLVVRHEQDHGIADADSAPLQRAQHSQRALAQQSEAYGSLVVVGVDKHDLAILARIVAQDSLQCLVLRHTVTLRSNGPLTAADRVADGWRDRFRRSGSAPF